jgi:hypothetical protein
MGQAKVRKMNGTCGSVAPTPQVVSEKKTKQAASRSSHTDAAVSGPRSAASTVHSRAGKKETLAQKKLRQARELVDAAKQEEQASWRAKWEAQKTDPVYQARQARLAQNREERYRKTAIGRENTRLARTKALVKLANQSEQDKVFTAWHEGAHAVAHTMLSNGVVEATIIPTANEGGTKQTKSRALEIYSLGHVHREHDTLPISARHRYLHLAAGLMAGGLATDKAIGDASGTGSDQEKIIEITRELRLSPDEAITFVRDATVLCEELIADPAVWNAIEEVKEALLTEKTIGGHLVRAILKKQCRPDLFPVEISKQLSFHFRQNYVATDSDNGKALYVLTVGDNPWFAGGWSPKPPYIEKITKDNAQPLPNFCPEPVQLLLLLSMGEQANTGDAVPEPPALVNLTRNVAFTFRQNMVEVDKQLLTGRVGSRIEIPGDHFGRGMSVVIKSHKNNVVTFEWQGMSVVVTQDGFEFDLCGIKCNSIGVLLAAVIDRYAQERDQDTEESEQEEYPLAEAA